MLGPKFDGSGGLKTEPKEVEGTRRKDSVGQCTAGLSPSPGSSLAVGLEMKAGG